MGFFPAHALKVSPPFLHICEIPNAKAIVSRIFLASKLEEYWNVRSVVLEYSLRFLFENVTNNNTAAPHSFKRCGQWIISVLFVLLQCTWYCSKIQKKCFPINRWENEWWKVFFKLSKMYRRCSFRAPRWLMGSPSKITRSCPKSWGLWPGIECRIHAQISRSNPTKIRKSLYTTQIHVRLPPLIPFVATRAGIRGRAWVRAALHARVRVRASVRYSIPTAPDALTCRRFFRLSTRK